MDTEKKHIGYFRKNWLSITSIVISIIAIALAIVFYLRSIESRKPVFLVDPNRTEIINEERISEAPLKIIRTNGEEISGNVYTVKLFFWNEGKLPIEPEHVLQPIKITLDDANGEILDFRVLKKSREVADIRIERTSDQPKLKLDVNFCILEKNDGFCMQIIYIGDPQAAFNIDGVIKGVIIGIENYNDKIKNQRSIILVIVGILLFALAIMAFLLGRSIGSSMKKDRSIEKKAYSLLSAILATPTRKYLYIVIVLTIVYSIFRFLFLYPDSIGNITFIDSSIPQALHPD